MRIKSCTLRSKFLRTIPINTVIKDPVNDQMYKIEEKKTSNNTLSKVATPYFGPDEAIEVEVDEHSLKMANPKRANVCVIMKNRISELEAKVADLNEQLSSKSKYEQIVHLMDEEPYHFDGKYLYAARDGIIFAVKMRGNQDETEDNLEDYIKSCWKNPSSLHSLMLGQKRLQSKLLDVLSKDSIEKEIVFSSV